MLETLDRTTGHTDQEVLSLLLRRYEMQLESTTHLVADRLEEAGIFPGDVRDLVYRHGLLFFAALEALGCELDGQERIACGAILAYSIPLVWIDSNLDGNVSGLRQHELPWSLVGKPRTVSLLTHLGYQDIGVDSRSNVSIQWISKIALAVIDAMSLDFTRRWNLKQFEADQAAISRYWESPTSRLNGSGIGSLMIGLASIQADGRVTAERAEIASILGRLRQVADELMDVDEDIRGGLITLPVLYGLNDERCRDFFHRMVRKLWMDSSLSAAAKEDLVEQLRETLIESGAPYRIIKGADALLSRALSLLPVGFPRVEPMRALLLHRRFQADRAIKNRLSDPSPHMTVGMLLRMD